MGGGGKEYAALAKKVIRPTELENHAFFLWKGGGEGCGSVFDLGGGSPRGIGSQHLWNTNSDVSKKGT